MSSLASGKRNPEELHECSWSAGFLSLAVVYDPRNAIHKRLPGLGWPRLAWVDLSCWLASERGRLAHSAQPCPVSPALPSPARNLFGEITLPEQIPSTPSVYLGGFRTSRVRRRVGQLYDVPAYSKSYTNDEIVELDSRSKINSKYNYLKRESNSTISSFV